MIINRPPAVSVLKESNPASNQPENSPPLRIGFPATLTTGKSGHEAIWKIYYDFRGIRRRTVVLDFSQTNFFEGNLSALLLVIVEKLKTQNELSFQVEPGENSKCEDLLARNGLLGLLAENPDFKMPDHQKSTVQARLFRVDEVDEFFEYIETDLLQHRSLGKIPDHEKRWLHESFFVEMFANANVHSGSGVCAACGQFFPKMKKLIVTLCDLGNGFCDKIFETTAERGDPIQTPEEAITWAVSGGSIYRTQGGSALLRIRKYCQVNGHGLTIVTDGHIWEMGKDGLNRCRPTEFATIGATIHLIFNDLSN